MFNKKCNKNRYDIYQIINTVTDEKYYATFDSDGKDDSSKSAKLVASNLTFEQMTDILKHLRELNHENELPYFIIEDQLTSAVSLIFDEEMRESLNSYCKMYPSATKWKYQGSAYTILEKSNNLALLQSHFNELYKERIDKQEECLKQLKIFDWANHKDNEYTYLVLGQWPHICIDKKIIVEQDDFNYCVKEESTNNISVVSKDRCFATYEKALQYQNSLIQRECDKEIKSLESLINKCLTNDIKKKVK